MNKGKGTFYNSKGDLFMQLVTYHSTVVFFDPLRQTLRHGPRHLVLPNVFLQTDGVVELMYVGSNAEARPLSVFHGPGAVRVSDAAKATEKKLSVSLAFVEQGIFGIRAGEGFLCAELDGSMSTSRTQLGQWEQFKLLHTEDARLPIPNSVTHRSNAGIDAMDRSWFALLSWLGNLVTINERTLEMDHRSIAAVEGEARILVFAPYESATIGSRFTVEVCVFDLHRNIIRNSDATRLLGKLTFRKAALLNFEWVTGGF